MILEKKVLLERMTWEEVKEAVKESGGIAIVPLGSTEQNGPHLPLDVDTAPTVKVAIDAAKQAKVVVAPTIAYGSTKQNMDFPGTLTIRPTILIEFVKDVVNSLITHGFDKIILLNGHGGNIPVLNIVAEEVVFQTGKFCCQVKCWELADLPAPKGTPSYDGHGGLMGTSHMLAIRPEDVYKDKYVDSKHEVELGDVGCCIWPPQKAPYYSTIPIPLMTGQCVKYGHFGDPKYASAERGKKLLEESVKKLTKFITLLKSDELKWRKK